MRVSFCMQKLHDISKTLPESASKSEKDFVPQTKSSYFFKFYISSVTSGIKKTPLYIRVKASYTLEAAVIIPMVAGFFAVLLLFFRILQIETQVQEALVYTSRKVATEASMVESPTALLASAEAVFQKELRQYLLPDKYVKRGYLGVSLLGSSFDRGYVELNADYTIKLPIGFFNEKGVRVSQTSKSRMWTGDADSNCGQNEDYVYVTEHGTVYHRNRECNYLDLTIRAVNYADVGAKRNKNEHKYYACSSCVAEKMGLSNVYITDYGTCYHASLGCSGLKRTIYLIPISEVGGKGACSKCGSHY